MAVLTPTKTSLNAVTLGGVAAAVGGDKFPWAPGTFLFVKNGSGGSINTTLVSQYGTGDGYVPADKVIAVGAGAEKLIGPIPQAFKDANGDVNVTYSAVASVTVQVLY